MRKLFLLLTVGLILGFQLEGQTGHKIEVGIENFENDTLLLAVHYGQSQYIKDTALVNEEGKFVFAGEEALPTGVYLVVLPPDQQFFQVLVTEKEQFFSVTTKADDLNGSVKFTGSPENDTFYRYISFLGKQNQKATKIREEIEKLSDADPQKPALQQDIKVLDSEVKTFQQYILDNDADSYTALIIKANAPTAMPEFEGDEATVRQKQWRHTQEHFFDNMDLGDERLLRTPFLFTKVDYFVNKLQVRHPDTLAKAVEYVLDKMLPAEETFKYYLIHYLNSFAGSKYVGMDAVYVHLVEKYYANGKAEWTDEEQLAKIVKNARDLKPLLIGKTAPNITLKKEDGTSFKLHDVESEYTVLYFWRYDCGVCKKSTPHMKEFFDNFRDRGVKVIAVCMKTADEDLPGCWDYIKEKEIGDWVHTIDPYKGRVALQYNVKSTPQVYILDDKKEIISKRIAAEQMQEVMEQIIEMRKKSDMGSDR